VNKGQSNSFSWSQCYSACCSTFLENSSDSIDQINLLLNCKDKSDSKRIYVIGMTIGLTFGCILLVLLLVSCLNKYERIKIVNNVHSIDWW